MKRQYMFVMFLLCFFVWAVVVDNVVIPKTDNLRQLKGTYSRYRIKEWGGELGKLDLLKNELLIYGHIKKREQLFYMEYKPQFKITLDTLEPGTPIDIRYTTGFPKVWKNELYDLRVGGYSVLRYSPGHLMEKQKEILKFSGIMAGAFLFLAALGYLNKPRRK